MKRVIVFLIMGFATSAFATKGTLNSDLKNFLTQTLTKDVGPDVAKFGKVIFNAKESLKKLDRATVDCKKEDEFGYVLSDTKIINMSQGRRGFVRSYLKTACGDGSNTYESSFLVFYPGSGSNLLVVQTTMQTIEFARSYGYSERSVNSVVISGSTHYGGGMIDVPSSVTLKDLVDDNGDKLADTEIFIQ